MRILESPAAAPDRRLPKARSLARNNAVTIVAAEPGLIEAESTEGDTCHRVRIELPCWAGQALADATSLIEKAMADAPAGLAPGDLPDELATALSRRVGLAVPLDEQAAHCTCSDRRIPCLHVLATLYTLTQRVDEHPRTALDLRLPHPPPALDHESSPDWIALAAVDPATFYTGE
ncbi:SWIM zinc finger family protein [Actinomadura sp. KC06]|uniref:SWIM zinc finger family protein n=1 Tax=Actinomadura sp. KC06 TaxID=2530369 RepID=UPI001405147C|nr:SWIM zinc finger family protein [Actinomadura sp. KC06]